MHDLYRRVRVIARRLVGLAADVDDIVHDVMITFLRARAMTDPRTFSARYIATAVRWSIVNRARLLDRAIIEAPEREVETPEEVVLARERTEHAGEILRAASPPDRAVLECRILHGHDAEETARILGVTTPGAVRVRLHRALARARKASNWLKD